VVASSSGQGGKDVADLNGITVPVKISGPLDAPQIVPDLRAAASSVVKQQAGRVEDKLKDQLKDKLKDLLRR
jgi:AsmA protein